MRVLVTGAAGFIGSWTASILLERGHEVIGTDLLEANGVKKTDITNFEALNELVAKEKPEAVIHLAAVSGSTGKNEIEQSLRQAYQNFRVNTLGTVNICEASRRNGVKKLVYMSTFAVYGRTGPERLPITPETPVSLEHAYAHSKYAGELGVRNYSADFGVKSVIFRTPFIVGERQRERNAVREFIETAMDDGELVVFGEGHHVREFIHPSDLVDAFNRALIRMDGFEDPSELIVLGNDPISMRELANETIRTVGQGKLKFIPDSGGRAFDQYADYAKAKELLGWHPGLSVKQILARIVANDYPGYVNVS